jgi:SAM-dependent methyltransferase
MSSEKKELEKLSRKVYHDIHLAQLKNEPSRSRLTEHLTTKYLKLPKKYFVDKTCGDFGCGSGVHGTVNLLNLQAKFVHALDLDDSFIESARNRLGKEASFENRWQLDIGSLLKLPYENDYFDFILCQGVIHHTTDYNKSVEEIYRTLKPGGKTYISVVGGKGGIATRLGMEILREEYQENEAVQKFLGKDLSPDGISQQIDYLIDNIENDGTSSYKTSLTFLECVRNLLDQDFIISLKDMLCAPIYKMHTEEEFTSILKETGFTSYYRVVKKLKYFNIRKCFTPLYFNYKHPLAKLLYGDGSVLNFVASK